MTQQQSTDQPSRAADAGQEDTAGTTTAVALCLTPAIAWSMTPLQLQVFQQLCTQQMADAGPHSLLPQVMEGFLWVVGCGSGGDCCGRVRKILRSNWRETGY